MESVGTVHNLIEPLEYWGAFTAVALVPRLMLRWLSGGWGLARRQTVKEDKLHAFAANDDCGRAPECSCFP
jgi:hypothetical protein